MKNVTRPAALGSLGLLAAMLAACSSSTPAATDGGTEGGTPPPSTAVDCGRQTCPQDPAITADSKKACEDALSGSCGGLYGLATECIVPKVKCGADGKTDSSAALAALQTCGKEVNAYVACANPDGGAGDSGK